MYHRLALIAALALCIAASRSAAQTTQDGAAADPAADSVSVQQGLQEAIRSTSEALRLLEGNAQVAFEEIEALFDRARNRLNDDAARQAIQDAYYDALAMLDAAQEGMRDEGRVSAISALETAIAILEDARDRLGVTVQPADEAAPG